MTAIRLNLPTAERRVAPYKLAGTPLAVDKRLPSDFNRSALPPRTWSRTCWPNARLGIHDRLLTGTRPWGSASGCGIRGWAWPAMDTAQRGMGVDWETAKELIQRTMRAAKTRSTPIQVACGAGTDHCQPHTLTTPEAIAVATRPRWRRLRPRVGRSF